MQVPPPPSPSTPPARWPRWRRRLAWAGLALLLALLAGLLFLTTCFATPPPVAGRPPILDEPLTLDARGRAHLGGSWFLRREGASLLYVEGDPFSLGYANGKLTADLMEYQERSLIETVRTFFPSTLGFWGIATLVLVNNRSLPDYVPLEYQHEVLGLSLGSPDPYPEFGPRYHRILNYHAAHDISHWVWDKPLVACTAFAARGAATRDGHLLAARNFDFEAGRHFDTNKVIGLYRPAEGYAFLSVSWPGMAGAVTGINEQRIYCSLNGAHSQDRGRIGTPVSLVVRRVLQYAGSLEEAVDIIREARVFVTDGYLIADGETGEALVVEKSPGRTEVRPMEGDLLLQTNHFEAPGFQQDSGNLAHQQVGTTCERRARLSELLQARAPLDPAAAAEVLRDRCAPGGAPLSLGNRAAINALIATHSVVCDVTQGTLWVSRGPYALGSYDAYGIEGFGGEAPAPPIPADPLLATDAAERVQEVRRRVEAASHDPAGHLPDLRRALELIPDDPQALRLLARALAAGGDAAGARQALQDALRAHPPFPGERREIEQELRAARSP